MNEEMVRNHWGRAMESLTSADILRAEGQYNDAVSRAYYGMMHAAKAALATKNLQVRSHVALQRLFGQHLVNTKEVSAVRAAQLAGSFALRGDADYDAGHATSRDEAEAGCNQAREFFADMRAVLKRAGFRDEDIAIVPTQSGNRPGVPNRPAGVTNQ